MTTIRFRGDDALILGDSSGAEIVIEPGEVANLHRFLTGVLADRERRLRDIANAV